jgi:hypothetical protein
MHKRNMASASTKNWTGNVPDGWAQLRSVVSYVIAKYVGDRKSGSLAKHTLNDIVNYNIYSFLLENMIESKLIDGGNVEAANKPAIKQAVRAITITVMSYLEAMAVSGIGSKDFLRTLLVQSGKEVLTYGGEYMMTAKPK